MFNNIIGNDKNKQMLEQIIRNKNIFHSYLLVGQEGIEDYKLAREFAKAILCLNEEEPGCNKCRACIEFDHSNHPDFLEITPDGNTIKIEKIREMTKKIIEKPIVSAKKVYIIYNSQLLTKEAQNSLLKTLEEPPEYACIILVTSNENTLLTTIKSRCLRIKLDRANTVGAPAHRCPDGCGQPSLQNDAKKTINAQITHMINGKMNLMDFLNSKEEIFENKEDAITTLEYINQIFAERIQSNNKDIMRITKCIELVEETKERLNRNSNFDMTIDRFLVHLHERLN